MKLIRQTLTFPLLFICCFSFKNCERFAREELGIADRLRFTSGANGVYNCTVYNKTVVSNLKIGVYTYDQKTILRFTLNDTSHYLVKSEKVEDFYFANIFVKKPVNVQNHILELKAYQTGSETLIDKTLLNIEIFGVRTSLPELQNSSLTKIKINDNVIVASIIGRLSTKESKNGVIYSMNVHDLSRNDEFAVTTDGRILVAKRLNATKKSSYEFKVNVKFIGAQQARTLTVEIIVAPSPDTDTLIDKSIRQRNTLYTQLNGVPLPELKFEAYNFTISELAQKYTIVGKIKYKGSNNLKIDYSIFKGNEKDIFRLNKGTGLLTLAQKVDYEETQEYELQIRGVTDYGRVLDATVHISVMDENDNAPVFSASEYSVTVREDAKIGSPVATVSATDKDSNKESRINFILSNDRKVPFTIDREGVVKVSEKLDLLYMSKQFMLHVRAFDEVRRIRQESEVILKINIEGVNLHRPEMQYSSCYIKSRYSLSRKINLTKFQAIDQDFEDILTFDIESNSKAFSIEKNGELYYRNTSDIQNEFKFKVYATDGIHFSKKTNVWIEFGVNLKTTVNCVPNAQYDFIKKRVIEKETAAVPTQKPRTSETPHFGLEFTVSESRIDVPENVNVGKVTTTFKALNRNSDCLDVILYTITSGNEDGHFNVDLFNGSLYVFDNLDRESKEKYLLTVRAADLHKNFVDAKIEIIIEDENDNEPIFSNGGFYDFIAQEGKELGYPLGAVYASDKDKGTNGEVTYSFIAPSKFFNINETTGIITLASYQAFKLYAGHTLQVIAKDRASENQLVNYATARITLSGTLNRPPLCLTDKQTIEIPFNMPQGSIVGRVFGYDFDSENAGNINYTISKETGDFHQYFFINADTGLIRLKKSLTSDHKGLTFSVSVTLQDGGSPSMKRTCHVYKIIVDELGVTSPVFNYQGNYLLASVNRNMSKGSLVKSIEANFHGRASTKPIFYQIVDGSGIGMFTIERKIGDIHLSNLNFLKPFYWLTIQAYVEDDPPVYRNLHMLIQIKSKEVLKPFFNPSVYHVDVVYAKETNRKIVQVFSRDRKRKYSTVATKYAIHSGDYKSFFSIKSTGWIYSTKTLEPGDYNLNISVTAHDFFSDPGDFSYASVLIKVTDRRIGLPIYSSKDLLEEIQVFASNGAIKPPYLFQPLAKISNINSDDRLTYIIKSDEFRINRDNAAVVATKDLKAGENHDLELIIKNKLNEEVTLFLLVAVIEPPKEKKRLSFKESAYSFFVPENKPDVSIHDFREEVEADAERHIIFYITSGNEMQHFYFPPGTQNTELIVLKPLDYEAKQSFRLDVVAFDGKTFIKTKVTINVKNMNDNKLAASQPCFEASLPENVDYRGTLITVQVNDADQSDSVLQGLQYILINDPKNNSPFKISNNGELSVKQDMFFDREFQNEHIVTAVAGSYKENTTFCVKVHIDDRNDHSPNFTQPVYEAEVLDSVSIGTLVLALYATDEDEGSNSLLSYRLIDESGHFEIDTKTGVVFVKQEFTRSSVKQTINLKAEVSDSGDIPRVSVASLKVTLIPDVYGMKFRHKRYVAHVSEKIRIGSLVTDRVRVNTSSVNYEIMANGEICSNFFWIDPFTGIILTKVVLDTSFIENCTLTILGRLHGNIVTRTDVFITIIESNEPPSISCSSYEGTVSEGTMSNNQIINATGLPVVVQATDQDKGKSGIVRYKFVEDYASNYFSVDSITGELLTSYVLDYEKTPSSLKFQIAAYDNGEVPAFSTANVIVNISNINDQMPYFEQTVYTVTLYLPVYNGTSVVHLRAKNGDEPLNDILTYGLVTGMEWFAINSQTGEIYVHNPSFAESQSPLSLNAYVNDGRYDGYCEVKIHLLPYQPSNGFKFVWDIYNASVYENIEGPTFIKLLNPVGYKPGEQLSFKLLNLQHLFDIDGSNGFVTTKPSVILDREEFPYFTVQIESNIHGKPSVKARACINLTVIDENDNNPVFTQAKYYRAVDIDSKTSRELLRVKATDADSGDHANITYSITPEEDYFVIDPVTGVISLKKEFIRSQTESKYIFRVQAKDSGEKSLSSESTVVIPVINKDQPMFSNNYYGTVSEDAQPGHVILKVAAKGRDDRQVYYQISDGDEYELFDVGFTTGEVAVAGTLDYSFRQSYHLSVKAIDSLTGSWSEAECDIAIHDVNNHMPLFDQPSYKVSVSENTLVGTSILTVTATDLDASSNADISYCIQSESASYSSKFSIDSKTGIITIARPLDADRIPSHFIKVFARDSGVQSKSSSTNVFITVKDVNDNIPIFTSMKYQFFVDGIKNKTNQSFVGIVRAFDLDENDQLEYKFREGSEFFKMDKKTGIVSMVSLPPVSFKKELVAQVDDGANQAYATVKVRITVRSEYEPNFELKTISVGESDHNNRTLGNIKATDKDHGKYGQLKYQIDSQAMRKYFKIKRNGDLVTKRKLDREDIDNYVIPVRATDGGGRFKLGRILVKVGDVNDNKPMFEFDTYQTNVWHSQMSDNSLMRVTAYDLDAGRNAELLYTTSLSSLQSSIVNEEATSLLNASGTAISFNNSNNCVYLAGNPIGKEYRFTVKALDNGLPSLQAKTEVIIAVKDWHKGILQFENKSYSVNVQENFPPQKQLLTVAAKLRNYNGSIFYEFIDGNWPSNKASEYFKIKRKSGKISLVKSLDHETVPTFNLMVKASAGESDIATCFIHINVININDNPPKFDSKTYKIEIAEDTPHNTTILQIHATDEDNDGSLLRYTLVAEDEHLFSLNSISGEIKTRATLDIETMRVHELGIVVTDSAGHFDKATVKITLIDVNDTPPKFEKETYEATSSEDTLLDEVIFSVYATDLDSNSIIQYFIKESLPRNIFDINIKTGDILLKRPFKEPFYVITVLAYDGIHSAEAVVRLIVQDVNNYKPIFASAYYNVSVNENNDDFVVKVEATDQDRNDTLIYTLQGDGNGIFDVDKETGSIRALERLDYEVHRQHFFKVIVTDAKGHSSDTDVFIKLRDMNDFAPKFLQKKYIATVRENATQASVVTQVKAVDRDTGRNRQIVYSVENDPENVFIISKGGIVTVQKEKLIKRKTTAKYSLIITASDNGTPQLSSKTHLDVFVLSVKDTPPKFKKLGYVFDIVENNEVEATVGVIDIIISENLKNHLVSTEVMNDDSESFLIDANGNVKARKRFDYEKSSKYTFTVKAWFRDIPQLSSVVDVEVRITDQNDHKPVFSQDEFNVNIDENVIDGTFVLKAFAADNDGSSENSEVSYFIGGLDELPFIINTQNGDLTVDGIIDHEILNEYEFYILAKDNGNPALSSKAKVKIKVNDLNDNPPEISEYNTTIIVQDDTGKGATILQLQVSDRDSPKNGAPFICSLLEGDSSKFEVTTEDTEVCLIKTKTVFTLEKGSEFNMEIRVRDSGTPQQFRLSKVKVIIVEESNFAPVIQNPKSFFVIVRKPYTAINIGKVQVYDQDKNDIHQYRITEGNSQKYFSIQEMTGIIEGKPPKGKYSLSIEVSDGKFSDSHIFEIIVNEIDERIPYKSIALTISGVSSKYFLDEKILQFNKLLAKLIGSSHEHVFIWSIQDVLASKRRRRNASQKLKIALAVVEPETQTYIDPAAIEEVLRNSKDDFANIDLEIIPIPTNCAKKDPCSDAQKCVVTLTPEEIKSSFFPNGYMGFVRGEKCICKDGPQVQGLNCIQKKHCDSNPCKPGYDCVEIGNSYSCECRDTRKCRKADPAVTLDGKSYIIYRLKKSFDELFTKFQIYFRTESQARSTIFDASGKDFFRLEVENGNVQSRFDFGGGPQSLHLRNYDVADGKWHKILIRRNGNFVAMLIDDEHEINGQAPGSHTNININSALEIVLGAQLLPDNFVSGFDGCIKEVYLHETLLPFYGENKLVTMVARLSVKPGCADSKLCATKHCPKFSDCINTLSRYRCQCLPGHYGASCASEMTCHDQPCQNNGKCTLEKINNDVTYKCTCPRNFTGQQCHINLNACASRPCVNNGKCISDDPVFYQCVCPLGFSGINCEINDSPCASNPCHYGLCTNFYGSYKCHCPQGRSGKQCAAGSMCAYKKCENGATCQELTDGAKCICRNGFSGNICENDINECLLEDICQSRETCINTLGSYYCNCTEMGIDNNCQGLTIPTKRKESGPPIHIIVPVVGVLIVLTLILFIIVGIKKRKSRYELADAAADESERKNPLDLYDNEYELSSLYPPRPPQRGVAAPPDYYNDTDQASPAMYDPSVLTTFSGASSPEGCVKVKFRRPGVGYQSDDGDEEKMPGYHWDYSEVPEDIIKHKMSREGSRIGLTVTDQYYEEDDGLQYVDIPPVPKRPESRRSSIPTYSECDPEVPKIPELPQQIRLSRNSLGNNQHASSPATRQRRPPGINSSEFQNRYSLLTDDMDANNSYLHDMLESETISDITNVTRPYKKPYARSDLQSVLSDSSETLDGLTETSLNSDEDDLTEKDPLDPDDTRKLERDIKRLFKDLQKKTEEDL